MNSRSKADEPWFGLAYASDDAYESPLSELKFHGATISKATRSEWEDWRRIAAPKNFVTYELLGVNEKNRWNQVRWRPGDRFMASGCLGLVRVKLAEAAQEIVHAQWPTHRPTFWYHNEEAGRAIWPKPFKEASQPQWLFEGYRAKQYFPVEANATLGVPRRIPGSLVGSRDQVAGAIFPARTDFNPNILVEDGNLPRAIAEKPHLSHSDADVKPELRGFAYCDRVSNINGFPSFIDGMLNLNRTVNRINGETIQGHSPRQTGTGRVNFPFVFERDEYVWFYRLYVLANIFGGL